MDYGRDGVQVEALSPNEGNTQLRFTFDYVFPPLTPQVSVYESTARPIVESVLEGFNGTVFAYGQTGSGKTYTMMGPNVDDERLKGIIPRMINTVFHTILSASDNLEFTVKVGYCEIYMEKIRDLLNPIKTNLKVHEDKSRGVYIADLTEQYVSEEAEVYQLMKVGNANREVAATQMNEGSSRSHSLFLVTISQHNTLDFSAKTGKLYLVDLAGCEKVTKTGVEGKRLDEAKKINKSLSTLGLVIFSLTDGKSTHVPYRDSKLTRVLQDSLGGNSKTALVITCSPSILHESETISTLRFGIRAKQITNKPKVNKEHTIAELKLLLSQAHTDLAHKQHRISQLESLLSETGLKLPTTEESLLDEMEDLVLLPPPEMQEMRSQLEDLWSKFEEQVENNDDLKRKLQEITGKNQGLVRQREEMQKQMNDLLEIIHQLEEKNNDFKDYMEKTEFSEKSHKEEMENIEEVRRKLEEKVKEQEKEIERLMREMTVRDR